MFITFFVFHILYYKVDYNLLFGSILSIHRLLKRINYFSLISGEIFLKFKMLTLEKERKVAPSPFKSFLSLFSSPSNLNNDGKANLTIRKINNHLKQLKRDIMNNNNINADDLGKGHHLSKKVKTN